MYQLDVHAQMVTDGVRMGAYEAALRRAVRTGCTVLDIGTGTGIFALLAAQLGASRVYAIEPSEAIYAAEWIGRDNGLHDRIRFLRSASFEVELPERVDLIVSDLRGVLPIFGRHIPTIVDARRRFLAAGGALIPRRDELWGALVTLPEWYERKIEKIGRVGGFASGLDLGMLRRALANRAYRMRFGADALLVEPRLWAELDYASIESPDRQATLDWTIAEPGRAHGIGLWFESQLDAETRFSTGPAGPETIYGRLVLPLLRPLDLLPGDSVEVRLHAKLSGDEYYWRWDTSVYAGDAERRKQTRLAQSTYYSTLLSLEQLRTQAADAVPALTEDGQWARFVLCAIDEGKSLGGLAAEAATRFPSRFQDQKAALRAVRSIAHWFRPSDASSEAPH